MDGLDDTIIQIVKKYEIDELIHKEFKNSPVFLKTAAFTAIEKPEIKFENLKNSNIISQ